MELVYTILTIIFLVVGALLVFLGLFIRDWKSVGIAFVLIAAAFATTYGLQSERNAEKLLQVQHLRGLQFQNVEVGYKNNADVSLPEKCQHGQLFLYKRQGNWFVGTEEIQSKKPVLNAHEVLERPEVRWWCSKPPIKN